MPETRNILSELLQTLKRQRDELGLQMHLGKAEAKDEFEKARRKLRRIPSFQQDCALIGLPAEFESRGIGAGDGTTDAVT